MKKLLSIMLGLGLLIPIIGLAQTGGDKGKKETTKAPKKEKSKKGSSSSTPPPK